MIVMPTPLTLLYTVPAEECHTPARTARMHLPWQLLAFWDLEFFGNCALIFV
jgi:hypothetical protein